MGTYTSFFELQRFRYCCYSVIFLLALSVSNSTKAQTSTQAKEYYNFTGKNKLSNLSDFSDKVLINANNDGNIDYLSRYNLHITSGLSSYENGATPFFSFPENKLPDYIDYNNDGILDYIAQYGNRTIGFTRNYKKEYVEELQTVMTPKQYAGEREEMELVHSYGMGSGVSMVGQGSLNQGQKGLWLSVDLNGDGLSDYYNNTNGDIYQMTEEGILIGSSLGGNAKFRDFNGDGLMDCIVYNSEVLTCTVNMLNKDGSVTATTLLKDVTLRGDIWCYDFDHDGDVDILIPVDYMVGIRKSSYDGYYFKYFKNGLSILLLAENKGDGTFKKRDVGFDGKIFFRQCVDYDADGNYEIIAMKDTTNSFNSEYTAYGAGQIISYEIKGNKIEDSAVILLHEVNISLSNNNVLVADLNSDGIQEIIYHPVGSKTVEGQLSGVKENTAPAQPDAPFYTYDVAKGLLKIHWSPSSDNECSAADLSYALRIGTGRLDGNKFYAHANSDGTRRNLMDGNCGFDTQRTLDVSSWPMGDYYIAVQAVDNGFRGSPFSNYVLFKKTVPASDFIISVPNRNLSGTESFGVTDTCRIMLRTPKESGCSYKWYLDDAQILSQVEPDADMLISFPTGGIKNISLQVTAADGTLSKMVTKKIEVAPASIIEKGSKDFPNSGDLFADLDGDGTTEILYQHQFYQGDETGSYTPIKKLWNTTINSLMGSAYVVDFNKDGIPDFYSPYRYDSSTGKEWGCHLTNEGDMQMEVEKVDAHEGTDNNVYIDIDNDGDLDAIKDNIIYENVDGSYRLWNQLNTESLYDPIFIDINKDGLIDYYSTTVYQYDLWSDRTVYRIKTNNGDKTFTMETPKKNGNWTKMRIFDGDGDGKWDKIYNYSSSNYGVWADADTIKIEWGNGHRQDILSPNGTAFSGGSVVYDIDNNGCLDMQVSLSYSNSTSGSAIYYFNADHSYTVAFQQFVSGSYYMRTNGEKMLGKLALANRPNHRPEAPTEFRSSQTKKSVVIEWNHSVDKETPGPLMRYNISIKRKGAEGEGAYLISPLNMGNDELNLPSSIQLLGCNRITIPITSIPAGEYEVQVQGVDRWYSQSKFSEVYELTVMDKSLIEMPTTATVDVPVSVKITDNGNVQPVFGADAVWEATADGYSVKWTTSGMKTVGIGNSAIQKIYVQEKPYAGFTMPQRVLNKANVVINGKNLTHGEWAVSVDGSEFVSVAESNDVRFLQNGSNESRTIVFETAGRYELKHTLSNEDTTSEYIASVEVIEENPVIKCVDIDAATSCYRIAWDIPENIRTEVQQVLIYKEGSLFDQYMLLDSVSAAETYYVDKTSEPKTIPARYKIAYRLPYGESEKSVAHRPVHVMINKGTQDDFNLSWNGYEGMDVESYRILGGSSADNLTEIESISGYLTSYSISSGAKVKYYAVEAIADKEFYTRSNVVCIDDAVNILNAREIVVLNSTGSTEIDGAKENTVQLLAYIYPVGATIQRVDWSITDGTDIATIDNHGRLSITDDGSITVRAQAVDGSGVYGEITLNVSGLTSITDVKTDKTNSVKVYPTFVDESVTVSGMSNTEHIVYVYNANGVVVMNKKISSESTELSLGKLSRGIYFIKVTGKENYKAVRIVKQ